MTYEQMIELGDRIGKVSKGFTKLEIAKIPFKFWRSSLTKQQTCSICYDEFKEGNKVKILSECKHEYHD